MENSMIFLIFCLQIISALATAPKGLKTNDTKATEVEKYGCMKIIMEDLQNQKWDEDEMLCLDLLTKIIKNVQNSTLWATWIWDSMQNPVGHLFGSRNNYGNYDECLEFPWEKVHPDMRTQYCLTHIHLSEVDFQVDEVDLLGNVNNYIRAKTKHHLKFNSFNWGVCTPAACKSHSVIKFVNVLFRQTHLGLAVDNPNITMDHCDIAGDKEVSYDFGYYVTVSFMVFVVFITFFTTWILNSNSLDHKYMGFFKAFHIPTNVQSMVKVTDNDVRSLFGIRVISTYIVLWGHVLWFKKSLSISNTLLLDKDYDFITTISFSIEMTVDTFLFMSGLLFVKSLMTDDLKTFNPLKVIVKRYFRLMWLASVIIMLCLNLFGDVSLGPAMTNVFSREMRACQKNWWANLLMVNNYIDNENMCHPATWSATTDFHLSVLATMIYWVYLKSRRAGLLLFVASFVMSIAIPAILVYSDYQRFCPLIVDFRLTDNYRKFILLNEIYITTHSRAGSFLVGMAIGYTMHKYNPNTHRKIINKKYSLVAFCTFLATFLGIFVLGNVILKYDYSPLGAAAYLSLKRIVWAVCIAILVLVCEYGTLPLVNSFLRWSAWVPISKLTHGIYLVHMLVMYYTSGARRNPIHYDVLHWVLGTFELATFSLFISLFLWMFIETPMQNIVSLVLGSGNKQVRRGEIKELNGHELQEFEDDNDRKIK